MEPRTRAYDGVTVTVDGSGVQGYHEVTVDADEAAYRFTFQQYAARPTAGPSDRIQRNSAPGLKIACHVETDDGFERDTELTVMGGRETTTVYNADLRDLSDVKLKRANQELDAYLADEALDETRAALDRFFHDVRTHDLLD